MKTLLRIFALIVLYAVAFVFGTMAVRCVLLADVAKDPVILAIGVACIGSFFFTLSLVYSLLMGPQRHQKHPTYWMPL